jgi:gamma-glutamylcyclotransferase (GGCT)/AIG2-like uncharacterized protein YtfP
VLVMVTVWQYGSNMDEDRLNSGARLDGAAKFIGLAIKRGYRLAFTHTNKCGVGTADIVESSSEDFVIGCLYEIPESVMPKLDRIEGVNSGAYKRQCDFVVVNLGKNLEQTSEYVVVQTYIVVQKEETTKTDGDYANHILKGIKERQMGESYFNKVKKIVLENNPSIEKELISYN